MTWAGSHGVACMPAMYIHGNANEAVAVTGQTVPYNVIVEGRLLSTPAGKNQTGK